MKVLKFGGTSVSSQISLQNLVKIVKTEYAIDNELIVVCSALSGITNLLQKMAIDASLQQNYTIDLKEVESIHIQLIKEVLPIHFQNEVLIHHKLLLNELENILESVSYLREISPKTNDRIISFGEKWSNQIVYNLLKENIDPIISVNTKTLIKTDSNFGNAQIDFELTEKIVQDWYQTLKNQKPVVIATGFIASDISGNTTTLGRGGSDYTASVLGALLNASEIQIWTDVNGFMTADPKWVSNAKSLPFLSYAEAMELSYFGAKVIYPPTMIPVINKQIPILIKNTLNPEFIGTTIHNSTEKGNSMAKGIASVNDLALINIEGNGLIGFKGFDGRLFTALANHDVNIIMVTQAGSEHSISFALSPQDAEKAKKIILKEFKYEFLINKIEKVSIEKDVSIVAVVGENMKHRKGIAGKVFHALGKAGVNIIAIAQGSSELNISMIIKKETLKKAINAIHNDLFLSDIKNAHLFVAGIGNIGGELLKQLDQQNTKLATNHNLQLNLIGIANSKKTFIDISDLQFKNYREKLTQKGAKISFDTILENLKNTHLPNLIFVDNTADASLAFYYKKFLENNISVVTCNKIATSSQQSEYDELKKITLEKNISFLYETNVGAGLPIIKTIQDLIASGDEIIKVEAILSGTLSYIFNQYSKEKTFAQVVKDAQEKGYTEPNPVDDLSGKDFARKMLILARESGVKMEMDEIEIEPILPEVALKASNLKEFYQSLEHNETLFAHQRDKAFENKQFLRYMGTFENGKVKLAIKAVDQNHPFYGLTGSDNIIAITTNRYLNNPLVVKGPGAGACVTAAGVFADIMSAANLF